jgi:hypothetical protein
MATTIDALWQLDRTRETATRPRWIERVSGITPAEFAERYRDTRRPVILTDALRGWPALERFTPEFFRSQYGDRIVRVRGRERRLDDIITMQMASTAAAPAPYPCTLFDCRGLLDDVTPRFPCSLPSRHASRLVPPRVFENVNHLELFFGGPGGQFPYLHYDMLHMHSWIAQVHGEKEFTFFEPGQEHLFYVHPDMPWISMADDLDDVSRVPLLQQARREKVVVRQGEALFIPAGTWHTARSLGMTVTVAFDQLEGSNWREFARDVADMDRRSGHRWRALATRAWLGAAGTLLGLAERFGANRAGNWPSLPR